MVVVEKYPLVVDAFSLRFGVHFSPPEPYRIATCGRGEFASDRPLEGGQTPLAHK